MTVWSAHPSAFPASGTAPRDLSQQKAVLQAEIPPHLAGMAIRYSPAASTLCWMHDCAQFAQQPLQDPRSWPGLASCNSCCCSYLSLYGHTSKVALVYLMLSSSAFTQHFLQSAINSAAINSCGQHKLVSVLILNQGHAMSIEYAVQQLIKVQWQLAAAPFITA